MSSETQPPRDAGAQREADIYDLLAWLEVNKKKVAVAAVVLVVIGFGIATVRYSKQQKEVKASTELLALKATLTPPTNVPPPQASALAKVASDFPGTSAAERAKILAATAFFTESRYPEAEKEFSGFLKDHPESPWAAEAAFGVAASQEAQNKINEAQASYQSVATAYANSSVADDAKLALARIFESQKKPDQALRLYNELLAPRPGAQPGQIPHGQAYERKEALLRQHPELNTNLTARPFTTILPQAVPSNSAPTGAVLTLPSAPTANAPAPATATETNAANPAEPKSDK